MRDGRGRVIVPKRVICATLGTLTPVRLPAGMAERVGRARRSPARRMSRGAPQAATCAGGASASLVSFVIAIYNLYLTYLAIQSGMNLPKNKALYVILIFFGIFLVIGVCVFVVFAAALAALFRSSQS